MQEAVDRGSQLFRGVCTHVVDAGNLRVLGGLFVAGGEDEDRNIRKASAKFKDELRAADSGDATAGDDESEDTGEIFGFHHAKSVGGTADADDIRGCTLQKVQAHGSPEGVFVNQ